MVYKEMPFTSSLGNLAGIAYHRFMKQLDHALIQSNIPLTADQFKMMTRLWEKDGISQQDIATKIGRNRSATGRMIEVLEKKGIVVRGSHPADQRLNLVYLTEKGKAIREETLRCAQQVQNQATRGLTESQVEQCKETLLVMLGNLA